MNRSNILIIAVVVVIGIGILVFMMDSAISDKVFPSLSEYIASTTPLSSATASTSDAIAATSTALKGPTKDIRAPKASLSAYAAEDPISMARGLGGLDSLPEDRSMIFIFSSPGSYGFWMKDMHFPLDIAWIDAGKKVVGVTPHISPETYPDVFYPPSDVLYVLEMNAGEALKSGIATGTNLVF